jgi:hypothetical protein
VASCKGPRRRVSYVCGILRFAFPLVPWLAGAGPAWTDAALVGLHKLRFLVDERE